MSRTGSDIRANNARLIERAARPLALAAAVLASSLPAHAAVISGVQTGTAVSTANGTLTVPIAAVNPATSVLFFETSADSNRPPGSTVRGTIASNTTLTFIRVTNEVTPVPINIRWYVASFASGVSVQRGEVAQAATVNNVTLPTAVAAVDHAFVTWSRTPAATDQNNLSEDDPVLGELTSTTNLQFRAFNASATSIISWQVVEFTNAPDVTVQKGTTSLTGGALTVDVTLPIAVNLSSTFVLVGYTTSGNGLDIGSRMLRAQLLNATTVRIDRAIPGNGDDLPEISWQVVDLKDGSEVIRGNASFAAGAGQVLTGLGGRRLNLSGAVAFASVQPFNGQSIGRTPYSGDDVVGVCSTTLALASMSLTLNRSNTADICDVYWEVIQFAPTLTTAVSLISFTAQGGDSSVRLDWETGAEMDNLGFNVYRGLGANGPWQKLTAQLIPGLGSSPDGAPYSYTDSGLANGTTYFYLLEDVDTRGKTRSHGPVSATPRPGPVPTPSPSPTPAPGAGGGGPAGSSSAAWQRYGDPEATKLEITERDDAHVVVDLRTGGFYAQADGEGGLRLSIPGFEENQTPGAPALPVRLAWLEAVAGRKVRLASVVSRDEVRFEGLRPAVTGEAAPSVSADGIVRAGVRRRFAGASFRGPGLFPRDAAELRGFAFQGDVKKAELALLPLRFDRSGGGLVLGRRLRVVVVFEGVEAGERSRGGSHGYGRRRGGRSTGDGVVARLATRGHGLEVVSFEDLFGARGRAVPAADIRLSRQGQTVAHHVEPDGRWFGPGGHLLFVSDDPALNPHGLELVYELSLAGGGLPMPVDSAAPRGAAVPFAFSDLRFEKDLMYQPALLETDSSWFWDYLLAPMKKSYPVVLTATAPGQPGHVVVQMQGGSDLPDDLDHHVRVGINGHVVGEASWDGMKPQTIEGDVPPGVLVDGTNQVELESVGDTGAAYSLSYLDSFELRVPRLGAADAGSFEASFTLGGASEIRGLPLGSSFVDTTDKAARWLVNARPTALGASLRVEAGRRLLAVAPGALLHPEVRPARAAYLRGTRLRADYVVLGPREFLAAAQPLLEQRQRQGLETMAVAIEDVFDEFGFGEPHPEAVKAFLEHAFQSWERGPRYVLLLGDATYDFKGVLGTGIVNRVPPYIVQDMYMRTVSDPSYATVNGDDVLPDLAIGRLPAETLAEAQAMVQKVVDWETAGFDLSGRAVLVADNSDAAGDFEADSEHLAATVLADRPLDRVYLSQLGSGMRPAIAAAFDAGAGLMSYLGHGGIAIWASENVWNDWDVPNLAPQGQQPFVLAMDCLNGYFIHPSVNALGEALVKAEGKGAIGVFAPSSLSVHWSARVYNEVLLRELVSGRHARIGDAVLAAQAAYLESGARPELLLSYELIGDPALRLRSSR
jgi:peptidase C25-like protein